MRRIYRNGLILGLLFGAMVTGPQVTEARQQGDLEALERSFHYQQGRVEISGGLATLEVPESFRFLGPDDAARLLVDGWGNPPGAKPLGMLIPAGVSPFTDEGWGVVITFDADGYVKDDEAESLDYAKLLRTMQKETAESNEARQRAGYSPIELVGWAAPPRYDKASHKLYWAKELNFGDDYENTLNYNIRILGRRGVLVLNAVAEMGQLPTVETDMQSVLAFVDFNAGHRYADFVPGVDKLAKYGIGALIAGKVASKAGFFKILLSALAAGKKLVAVAVVGVVAFIRKLFIRKRGAPATAAER
jgi:uncharacterized membrane-anchored protein